MASFEEITALAHKDLQRHERGAAKARQDMEEHERQIERLRAFLSVGEYYTGERPAPARRRREGGKTDRVLSVCRAYYSLDGAASIDDLLGAVRGQGIEIGGDEKQRLASYLSKSPEWTFEHGVGWHYHGAKTNEAADTPEQEPSAASSVHSNQGGLHETALI